MTTPPIELAGVAEIAAAFGVKPVAVSMWASRRAVTEFPKPVQELAMGPVYDMGEVRRWHASRVDGRTKRWLKSR